METVTSPEVDAAVAVSPAPEVAPVVATAPVEKPSRKSQKGKWGKVGAPPKLIKYPRGAFTITQLVALNPEVCELTLRNTVTNNVRGFKIVKTANGPVKVEVPVTLVKLPKNADKETVGRPNFRFMSKAAFDANQKNLKAKPVKTPVAPVAPEVTAVVA